MPILELDEGGGVLLLILFLVVLIAAIVWALMRLFPRQADSVPSAAAPLAPARGGETPLDILDRRLVSGEIDVAAYRRIRSAMDGVPDPDAYVAPGGNDQMSRMSRRSQT